MSHTEPVSPAGPNDGPDPELIELPSPRRPFRRLTLASLVVTFIASVGLLWGLQSDIVYAIRGGPALDAGTIEKLKLEPHLENRWVRGEGELAQVGGIRYVRPLESDSYRLAPLTNSPNLWIQIRVPSGYENEHFVPPTVFSGRLVPFSALGLRYGELGSAPKEAGWQPGHLPKDAWLLIDGETPKSSRWLLGLVALFVAFGAFAIWALLSLLRPLPEPTSRGGHIGA
jgi:hypothetical protein